MKIGAFRRTILLTLLFQGAVWKSQAAVIIDTGTPPNSGGGFPPMTFPDNGGFVWLAGQFTINSRFLFTGAEGWIGNYANTSGTIDLSLVKNAGGIPGEVLFTQSFAVPAHEAGQPQWLGVLDEDIFLKAGTYWIVFAPQAGTVTTFMPFNAPDPLDNYAAWISPNTETWVPQYFGFGMRVSGNIPIAPEPSFYGLAAAGLLGGLAIMRRRFRSKPKSI